MRMNRCRRRRRRFVEPLEVRTLLSAAFDVTGLTAARADPAFTGIDGSDLAVAVLDTGLFASHPDIVGNFARFFDAVGDGRFADTSDGTTDPAQAFDPQGEGHGTHVAGTVGSTNTEIGVAPGTNLVGVRVLLSEGDSQPVVNPLVAGLEWVLANQAELNIRVVNMSLGSNTNFNNIPNKDDVGRLIDQLEARGVTVVAASGNSYGGFASLGTAYPSIFSTIAVANTWEDSGTAAERSQVTLGQGNGGLFGVLDEDPNADQLSASSQRSTLSNQVAAPGTTIFSTWNNDGGLLYNTIAGTSMASPFVAGAVALMQDAAFTFGGRYLSPDQVLTIIRETADDIVDAQDPSTARFPVGRNSSGQLVRTGPTQDLPESGQTFKRINVHRALQRVRDFITGGTNPAPPPPDPGQRTDDTNNTLAAATTIPTLTGIGQFAFTGNIGSDGDVNVGTDDIDLYRIELTAPGFPVFDFDPVEPTGVNFDPFARLFDSAGNQLTFEDDTGAEQYPILDTATKLPAPLQPGTYFLGVSAFPNNAYNPADASGIVAGESIGDYSVTISLGNPDPNGVVQGAFPIDLTNPDSIRAGVTVSSVGGFIISDPNPLTANGEPRIDIGPTDVDFFEVVAPDTGQITVDIDSQTDPLITAKVDSFVAVYDENLAPVASNDDENFALNLFDSLLTFGATQGARYFVAITTFQNRNFSVTNPFDRTSSDPDAVGEYKAFFSFDNGDVNGTVINAVDFNDPDGVLEGTIGADLGTPLLSNSTNGGAKDVDFFAFAPTQAGMLQIDATGENGFDAVLGLWTLNAQNQLVPVGDTNDAPSSIALEITQAMVEAEQAVFISVTGVGNQGFNPFAEGSGNGGETGNYSLAISQRSEQEFRARTNNSIANHTPELVFVGEPIRADLGRDGTVDVGSDDIDIYRFDSPFNGTLSIRTDTSDEDSADTFLRVFNDQGVEIAFNNNASDSTAASAVSIPVTAGATYFIGVNGASASAQAYLPLTGEGAADGSEGHYGLVLEATDSDIPLVSVSDVTVSEVLGEKVQAVFTLTLSGAAASGTPTVNVATEDGSAAAGADYVATSTTVSFAGGARSATVAVDVIGDFDNEDAETFVLRLSGASGLLILDNQGVGAIVNAAAPAPTTFEGRTPLTFTPAGGSPVSITIRGAGSGSAFFLDGAAAPSLLVFDGTTASSSLTIRGTNVSLPDVRINGSIKALGSRTTDLAGDLTVTGAAARLTFDDVTGAATVTIGGGNSVTIAADVVQDVSINSAAAIKSIKVGQWLDTDATADVIAAPSISALSARGAFQAGVTAGVIGKVNVSGALSGSAIRANESIAGVTVGSVADSSIFAGVSGNSLPDSADDFASATAVINSVTVRSRTPGAFSDTLIAAANLGKVSLGAILSSNSGSTFGVAALTVRSVALSTDASDEPVRGRALDDPADSVTAGDFLLRLL